MKLTNLFMSALCICACLIFTPSCSDDDDSDMTPNTQNDNNNDGNNDDNNDDNNDGNNDDNNDDNNDTPDKTRTEILAKRWIVDQASVEGLPDNSSKGLILDVRADGSYTLVTTGYIGTWEFNADETKINWDKGTQFNQVFTLEKFKENKIEATFKSFATGQDARWVMIPN